MSVMYIRNEQTGEFEPVPSLVGPQGPPGTNGDGAGMVTAVNNVAPDTAGNVTLTAANVGARPDTWTPTASDVGALPSDGTAVNANQLNGKSADQYMLKTDTAADSYKLDGKDSVYYHKKFSHPRNLLDNSDFTNPVNQRGATTVENGFIVDRWYTFNDNQSGGATLTPSGITLSGNGYLQQRLLKGIIQNGKQYTFARYYSDGTVDTDTNKVHIIDGDFDLINNVHANGKTISHVALYEGEYTADNLPPYVPKGYAVELAECQRYYKPRREYILYCYSSGYLFGYGFEVRMLDGVNPTPMITSVYTVTWGAVDGDTTIMDCSDVGFGYVMNSNFKSGEYYRVTAAFSSEL